VSSDTPHSPDEAQTFRVTHPFHPLAGRQFPIATLRHTWGEDRVYFYDDDQRLQSVPLTWTSLTPADPFVLLSAGRAPFHLQKLIELLHLLHDRLAVTPDP
jgi:hypothetical protein